MMVGLLIVALSCTNPTIINDSDEPWNDMDRQSVEVATKRCEQKYKNSPCLVRFIKRGTQRYWAICGGRSERR